MNPTHNLSKLFVDTSFFVATADQSETNHQKAVNFISSIPQSTRLITTDFIIDETVTRIRTLLGVEAAYRAGAALLDSGTYKIVMIDKQTCLKALEKFRKFSDKVLSFTDCTSFVVMDQMKIKTALAFDDDFVKVGFQVVPL